MRVLMEAAEIIDRAGRRELRRQRAHRLMTDFFTGLIVLVVFVSACVWLVGVAASLNWLIGAFQ